MGVYRCHKRVCTENWLWEKNPFLHQWIEPVLVACWSDALPTELHSHPKQKHLEFLNVYFLLLLFFKTINVCFFGWVCMCASLWGGKGVCDDRLGVWGLGCGIFSLQSVCRWLFVAFIQSTLEYCSWKKQSLQHYCLGQNLHLRFSMYCWFIKKGKHICTHAYKSACMRVCVCVCACVCVHLLCVCVCTCACMYVCVCAGWNERVSCLLCSFCQLAETSGCWQSGAAYGGEMNKEELSLSLSLSDCV